MSTHFIIKHIVSYYIDLLSTIYSYIYCFNLYFIQQKGFLYHVSLLQYYDYIPLIIAFITYCIYSSIY